MHNRAELEAAGRSAADAYRRQHEWVHRRVESLTFPSPDELVVRRELSFDFSIPAGLHTVDTENTPIQYVPLSLVRKWPPVIGLDLNSDGHDLPFLTRSQNDVIDHFLLLELAEKAVAPSAVAGDLRAALEDVVRQDGDHAAAAYAELFAPSRAPQPEDLEIARRLEADQTFLRLAGDLVSQTVLWVPIRGAVGDRTIVKLGYDIRREISLFFYRPAAYGWMSFKVGFDLPHIGTAGSYHLDIATPSPLRVVDARLRLYERGAAETPADDDHKPFGPLPKWERDARTGLKLHERADERHGSFYVSGDRDYVSVAWIKVLVEKDGYIRGAFVSSLAVTAILAGFYWIDFDAVVERGSGAATTLLFLPALLGYFVAQVLHHALAKAFLSGLRKLVALSIMLPAVGAGLLVVSGGERTDALDSAWLVLICVSAVISMVLLASSYLPLRYLRFGGES